mgnify:CR=1 FL=1
MTVQQINPAFWQGKRVVMTGHSGFKGSWLSLWLQSMGAELRGIALTPPTTPALFNVARVAQDMDCQVADIRDYDKIRTLVAEFKPEILIHMAAQPLVRLSYQQPIETYATNVMGTVHLLEAVRNTPGSLKEMATSFMARDRDVLLKIILPAASPVIFSGLRLGVSAGFIGAILSELKITPTGVGDIITYSRSIADYPSMYAAIFSIILLAVIFLNLLEKLENILFEGNNRGYASD